MATHQHQNAKYSKYAPHLTRTTLPQLSHHALCVVRSMPASCTVPFAPHHCPPGPSHVGSAGLPTHMRTQHTHNTHTTHTSNGSFHGTALQYVSPSQSSSGIKIEVPNDLLVLICWIAQSSKNHSINLACSMQWFLHAHTHTRMHARMHEHTHTHFYTHRHTLLSSSQWKCSPWLSSARLSHSQQQLLEQPHWLGWVERKIQGEHTYFNVGAPYLSRWYVGDIPC